jgi:hypothetical protein
MEKSFSLTRIRRNSFAEIARISNIVNDMRQPIPCSQEIISTFEDKFPEVVI